MRNRDPKKKQKGQESTIGKIIYGFLLFLPLLAIGVTCGYAMINKNAYKTSNEKISISYEIITSNTSITEGLTYYVKSKGNAYSQWQGFTSISLPLPNDNINYDAWELNFNSIVIKETSTNTMYTFSGWNTTLKEFSYVSNGIKGTWQTAGLDIYGVTTIERNWLGNAFYYSIDKVQQSPLFNWAENSIIYTTTASTCTALSITTPFIPLLMSYWLIISVIYFLYDIALMLVWILHRKIHELQESI